MITDLIQTGFGNKEDYSCAEKIVYAANRVYELGLDKESMKMSAGLAGGLFTGLVCGALSAGALVLAKLFVKDRAHESSYGGNLVNEFVTRFQAEMNHTSCDSLKENYRHPQNGCTPVVLKAALLLDEIIQRELGGTLKERPLTLSETFSVN